ncbi:MAG: TRAP transporter TatT component family protein [Elusimicrobiaceae bacterium]|nr:TRAP transporter TatT component family protein [Elusimicrobiaceae bacterium]
MRNSLVTALLAWVLCLCGCSLNRVTANAAGGMIAAGMPAFLTDPDTETARQSLLGALKTVEAAQLSSPRNTGLLDTLAQGYCGYAFMFLEDGNPERASAMYLRGAEFARQSLQVSGAAAGGIIEPGKARRAEVPALFWNTFCRAGYLQLSLSEPAALADISDIEAGARRVAELDGSFYYNSAHTVLGALYAARPAMLGGDPARAKAEFALALKGAGARLLANRYMYARLYAVQAQDAELFETELSAIVSAPPDLPEQALANEAVKAKAKRLLEKKDDLF